MTGPRRPGGKAMPAESTYVVAKRIRIEARHTRCAMHLGSVSDMDLANLCPEWNRMGGRRRGR